MLAMYRDIGINASRKINFYFFCQQCAIDHMSHHVRITFIPLLKDGKISYRSINHSCFILWVLLVVTLPVPDHHGNPLSF